MTSRSYSHRPNSNVGGIWSCRSLVRLLLFTAVASVPCIVFAQAPSETVLDVHEAAARSDFDIPDEERDMTDAELLEKMANEYTPWPTHALRLRAEKYSPEEREVLAQKFKEQAAAIAENRRMFRLFCSKAGAVLAPEMGVPLMAELLLETRRGLDARTFVAQVSNMHPAPEATAAELLYKLHTNLDNLDGEQQELHFEILTALGNCGEPGFDTLMQLPWNNSIGLIAIGKIGTERAIGHLLEYLEQTDQPYDRAHCLRAFAERRYLDYSPEIQQLLRTHLDALLKETHVPLFMNAIEIAGAARDPYFLPTLEAVAAKDREDFDTGGAPNCNVPEDARIAIERIKKANNLYTQRELLELELQKKEQLLADYKDPSQYGMGPEQKAKYVQQITKEIEGLKEKIAQLAQP